VGVSSYVRGRDDDLLRRRFGRGLTLPSGEKAMRPSLGESAEEFDSRGGGRRHSGSFSIWKKLDEQGLTARNGSEASYGATGRRSTGSKAKAVPRGNHAARGSKHI
jgi:hypothetical protein